MTSFYWMRNVADWSFVEEVLPTACESLILSAWFGRSCEHERWWSNHMDEVVQYVCADTSPHLQMVCAATYYVLQYNTCFLPPRFAETVDELLQTQPLDRWHLLVSLGRLKQRLFDGEPPDSINWVDLKRYAPDLWPIAASILTQIIDIRRRLLCFEFDTALASCDELLDALTAQSPVPWGKMSDIWMLKGMILQWQGQYEEAEEFLFSSCAIAQERHLWGNACSAYGLIAQLQQLNGDLVQARSYYQQADLMCVRSLLRVDDLWPIYPRIVRLFLLLELGEFELAYTRAQQILELLVEPIISRPRLIARTVCVLACEGQLLRGQAKAHFHVLTAEQKSLGDIHIELRLILQQLWDPSPIELESTLGIFERFTQRIVGSFVGQVQGGATVFYQRDGNWIETAGKRYDLQRRHTLKRAFMALLQANKRALTNDALIEQTWPDESIDHLASMSRLRVLIYELRKVGLKEILITVEGGYRLDPSTSFVERAQ